MINSFFVSDLHGKKDRYEKLINKIKAEKPLIVFIGGDLLPHYAGNHSHDGDFITDYLIPAFTLLKKELRGEYPVILIILGNDDPKTEEKALNAGQKIGVWHYIHNKHFTFREYRIFGYNYVPPTPFQLKDWEKYDVSRFVDPGCVSPEEGRHTFNIDNFTIRNSTIQQDLEDLSAEYPMDRSVFLFHSPPYQTDLDRAALDGKMVDHVPLDIHVGSIAIKKFIENNKPHLTLHGHVHESTGITGKWSDKIGSTICLNASHDKKELALIKFKLEKPEKAIRELI
jgi:Icc-related predicted phosphoesterase